MSETQQNHDNADHSILSNGHVDTNKLQEGMLRMKIEKEDGEPVEIYPVRPGEPDCSYYTRHKRCDYGPICRFNHPPLPPQTDESKNELPQREGQPDCGHFIKTGTCKFEQSCKYHHPLDRRGAETITFNSLGLPLRKNEIDCAYYMRTDTCKFGAACKFNHPEPTSLETANASPLLESSPAVGIGSSITSTGVSFGIGPYQPAWPTSSCFPPPQAAYMPYFLPAFQPPLPTPNWNNYLGNLSSNLMGTDLMYNSKNPGEVVTDQPKCHYFMEPGGCKYGSSCKFLHPREKPAHTLGPHGLPLRPGEDICGDFNVYGICRFGPICKYNHPLFPAHFSGCYFGMPTPFPTQRNFPASSSTDTTSHSQSKSLNITEWIQKPETVVISDKNRQHSTKPLENGHEKADIQSKEDDSHENGEIPQEQQSD